MAPPRRLCTVRSQQLNMQIMAKQLEQLVAAYQLLRRASQASQPTLKAAATPTIATALKLPSDSPNKLTKSSHSLE